MNHCTFRHLFLKFSLFVVMVFFLLSVTSCRQHARGPKTQWQAVSPPVDSLAWELDTMFVLGVSTDTILDRIQKLEKIPEGSLRGKLFRARYYRKMSLMDSSLNIIQKIKSNTDSTKDPYTWSRIKLAEMRHSKDTYTRFVILDETIKYYREIKDSLMLASNLVDMGIVLWQLHLFEQALNNLSEGQRIYDAIGLTSLHARCDINKALLYRDLNNDAKADSIEWLLFNDQSLKKDTPTYEIVLRNVALSTQNPSYLKQDIEMISIKPYARYTRPLLYALMSEMLTKKGHTDSADYYAILAHNSLPEGASLRLQERVSKEYARVLRNNSKLDSACMYYLHIGELKDSIQSLDQSAEVIRMESNSRIARYEQMMEEKERIERLHWLVLVTLILLIAAVATWLLNRRHQQEKLRKLQIQIELDKSRRHAAASLLAIEEKDKLLDTMYQGLQEIEGAPKENNNDVIRDLEQMIKVHSSSNEDRQSFLEIFEKTSPAFVKNLREQYPKLTENQIRLAVYIHAGLSNHQIARILMVQLESVHQMRRRMRLKMGLPPNGSIEDLLDTLEKPF